MKSSKHTKDLIAKGLLKIKVSRKEPPTHAWDWKQFNCLLHEELDYLTTKTCRKKPYQPNTQSTAPDDEFPGLDDDDTALSLEVVEDGEENQDNEEVPDIVVNDNVLTMTFAEMNNFVNSTFNEEVNISRTSLDWDDSPIQYDLTSQQFSDWEDLEPILQTTPLFADESARDRLNANVETAEDDVSLTSEDEDENVFFHELAHLDMPATEDHFHRNRAIRKNKHHIPPDPLQADDVRTNQVQNLNNILQPLHPIVPEAVNLGSEAQVQNVGGALVQVHLDEDRQAEVKGSRKPRVDYLTFHRHGRKERKDGEHEGRRR